jgi:hypothetical protein
MAFKNNIKSITFFYPSRITGGAEYLYIRLANKLVKMGYDIRLIDYNDGFLRRNVDNKVDHISYEDGKKVEITFDTHVVLPPLFLNDIKKIFTISDGVTVYTLFWSIAPHNIVSGIRGFHRYTSLIKNSKYEKCFFYFRLFKQKEIKHLINYINDNGGIYFMDYPNFYKNKEFFNLSFSPKYIQIPIEEGRVYQKDVTSLSSKDKLIIAWYGRLGREKVESLKKVLIDINHLFKNSQITNVDFLIIGEGDYLSDLKKFVNIEISFNVKFLGTLNNNDAKSLISEKVDLAFAMGTSTLEIAQTRTPVISLDFSFNRFPNNYKYCWLYEREGYSLGDQVRAGLKNKHSMKQIFEAIYDNYENIANMSYNYVRDNHNIDGTIENLIIALESSNSKLNKLL